LAIFRGLAVGLIAFLLLSPVIRSLHEDVRKPVFVIGVDQSQSVGSVLSVDDQVALNSALKDLGNKLSVDHDVVFRSIGSEYSDTLNSFYSGSKTDISAFFKEVDQSYSHTNLGGIILASDGIYNQGANPIYQLDKLDVPVHSIMLGDTSIKSDINIHNIFHNEVAFLGDRFQIEVDIQASNLPNTPVNISLLKYQGNRFIKSSEKNIEIIESDEFHTISFEITTENPGIERYRISIPALAGEENTRNNSREFFIDVLDSRQKILIVKNSPHPDLTALKQILSTSDIYEVNVTEVEGADEFLDQSDIVILHGLPSSDNDVTALINRLDVKRLPRLFILSSQSVASRFNTIQSTIEIANGNGSINEVQALVNPTFDFFELDAELKKALSDYPPLLVPFGEFTLLGGSSNLANQKIGKVSTSYPLIAFSDKKGIKEGVITGEGIWRWRLVDFVKTGKHDILDGLVKKIVQYLSVKANKDNFRVKALQNIFEEGEHIGFMAELYNNAFEKVNDPEVDLSIRSSTGEEFKYIFSRIGDAYQLDAGVLQPGDYSYTSKTTLGGKAFTKNGTFAIKAIDLEYYNTVADHKLLRSISEKMGGQSYFASQLDQLGSDLLAANIKPEIVYTTRTKSAMHYKWIFGVLLILLSLEWFLRRYFGRY
jgi:hypothetical protein